MADSIRYIDWLNKAKAELESAEILMAHDGSYAEMISRVLNESLQ
jgi:hypothetical protein